jgi:hypothetical protein
MEIKNGPQHFRQEPFLPFLEIVSAVVILVNHSRLFVLIVIRLQLPSVLALACWTHHIKLILLY